MLWKKGLKPSDLNWTVIIGIGGIHLLALLAVVPRWFTWSGLAISVFLYWLSGWIGITLCYHRLLTHWSFKTPNWFLYLLTIIGTINFQGGPRMWVGIHRLHHAHSDTELDPHSRRVHGFDWSHFWWLIWKHPEGTDPLSVTLDLQKRYKCIMAIDRWSWIPPITLGFLLYGIGYWVGGTNTAMSWIVWGVGFRTAAVYHATWFVNSAAHSWGYRSYETSDGSRNNWWVALLSGGEGWHNNHHADQVSAAHGWRWYEVDPTYWTIRFFGLLGLAKEIKTANPQKVLEKFSKRKAA